jgi:hypothetical protein
MQRPYGLFPVKAPVLGAADGIQSVLSSLTLRSFPRATLIVIHKRLRDTTIFVIPAGIAGIHDCKDAGGRAMHGAIAEKPWMAILKQAQALQRGIVAVKGAHVPFPRAAPQVELILALHKQYKNNPHVTSVTCLEAM